MAYCPQCGVEVEPDESYCHSCGASLTQGEEAPTETEPDPRTESESPRNEPAAPAAETTESEQPGGSLAGRFWLNSGIGGVVAFVVGMVLAIVLGPLYVTGIFVGAALGGFLHRGGIGSGAVVGLVAGIIATVPFILLLAAAFTFGFGGAFAAVDPGYYDFTGADLATAWGFVLVFVGVVGLIVNAIFGVIGGLVGGAIGQ